MFDFENTLRRGSTPPRRLIGMSFRLSIPWRVALQQSPPPLSQPTRLCNDMGSSVDLFYGRYVSIDATVSRVPAAHQLVGAKWLGYRHISFPKLAPFRHSGEYGWRRILVRSS